MTDDHNFGYRGEEICDSHFDTVDEDEWLCLACGLKLLIPPKGDLRKLGNCEKCGENGPLYPFASVAYEDPAHD